MYNNKKLLIHCLLDESDIDVNDLCYNCGVELDYPNSPKSYLVYHAGDQDNVMQFCEKCVEKYADK